MKPDSQSGQRPALPESGAVAPVKLGLLLLPFALLLIILPFPGTVAARLLCLAICFCVAVWQWWWVPGARAKIPCKTVLGVWISVSVASLAYAFDFRYTLRELQNELGYTMMTFFSFFVIAHQRSHTVWLLRAAALGVAIIGTWAIFGWVVNDFFWREGAGHGGIGVFATYVVTVIPGLVWLAFEDTSPLLRRTAFGLTFFALLLAAITMQRAIWPVLALQLALALIMGARAGFIMLNRTRLSTVIGCVFVVTVASLVVSHQIRYADPQYEHVKLNTDIRLAFWPKVLVRIAEHPFAGTGFGRGVIHKAYPDLTPPEATVLWHAHNVILNYGLEMGVPGMLSVTALFVGIGIFFWSAGVGSAAAAGIAGAAIVAGVFLRNQFNDFFLRDMSLLFWALAGLFARVAVTVRRAMG